MSEVSIAKGISGPEAIEAAIYALKSALGKDDRFLGHMAYSGFRCRIKFEFFPNLSFIPPTEKEIEIGEGQQNDIAETATVTEIIELPLRPPNQVREEANLPQPVLVSDGQGKTTEKWIKPAGKVPMQPKIKIKGI